jgi:arylsulfatase A-like enzyme
MLEKILRRAKRLLHAAPWSRADLVFLCALNLPLLVYVLVFKIERVQQRRIPITKASLLTLCTSDVLMQLAWLFLGLGLLAVAQGKWPRRLARGFLVLVALLTSAVVLASHGYFMSSGTTLDWPLLWFGLSHIKDTAKVIDSARTPWRLVAFAAVVACSLVLPFSLARLSRGQPTDTPKLRRASAWLLSWLLAGACTFAAMQSGARFGRDISRDAVLNVLATLNLGGGGQNQRARARALAWPLGPKKLVAGPTSKRKNVVLILLESTGAWATSLYGGPHQTTPSMASLAEQGVLLEGMRALVPHTTKALVTILCGVIPRLGVGAIEALPDGIPARCLPDLLEDLGYDTTFMQAATREFENRSDLSNNLGFGTFKSGDEMDASGLKLANYFGYEDRILVKPVRDWLGAQKSRRAPFLLTVLTNTPHHDYRAVFSYGRKRFSDDARKDRYLNAVYYQDFVVRDIVESLRQTGHLEDTIVIVMGDHGEGFGQHGRFAHDDVIYEEGLHIPFIWYESRGGPAVGRKPGNFSELDVAPSIVARLGLTPKDGSYEGRSIFAPPEERVLYASCYGEYKCVARYEGTKKLIHHFGRRSDELFDLASDREEKVNLLKGQQVSPQIAAARADVLSWYEGAREVYRDFNSRARSYYVSNSPFKPGHPLNIRFGDTIELLGWDTSKDQLSPGGWVNITWYFHVLETPPAGLTMFVSGYDGDTPHKWDHVPVQRSYPVEEWKRGEYIRDVHRIALAPRWHAEQAVIRGGFRDKKGQKLKTVPAAPNDDPVWLTLPVKKR